MSKLSKRSRRRRSALAGAAVVAAATLTAVGSPGAAQASPSVTPPWAADQDTSGGWYETFAPDGSITLRHGGPDQAPVPLPFTGAALHQRAGGPTVVPMHTNGPSANRIDLLFIGDGYTQAELPKFAASAERSWKALMAYEPYKTYQNFFNAERIDIVSPVSGISNDPNPNTPKSTPLGMHFWCHNIDRLLCVNTKAAQQYAGLVPGRMHVLSLANTTTYGGAGGSITTLAGENSMADGVIVHEMSHTIGQLGDEYDVPYEQASGSAGTVVNASEFTADQLRSKQAKWFKWLGAPSADGGTVGAFEGANYYKKGFYRPSVDSEMRTLGKQFNPPSIEALVKSFYTSPIDSGKLDSIDSATPVPDANGVLDLGKTLSITTIPLVGSSYQIWWGVDGATVPGSLGATSLKLSTAPLKKGQWNAVSVYVRDTTSLVRDEDFRAADMTKSRQWWVWGG